MQIEISSNNYHNNILSDSLFSSKSSTNLKDFLFLKNSFDLLKKIIIKSNIVLHKNLHDSIMKNNKALINKSINSFNENENNLSMLNKNNINSIGTESDNNYLNVFPNAIAHFQQLLHAKNLQQFYSKIQQQNLFNQLIKKDNNNTVLPSTSSNKFDLISLNINNNNNDNDNNNENGKNFKYYFYFYIIF